MPIVSLILCDTKVSARLRSFGLNPGTFFQCKNLYLLTERIPDIQSLTQIDGMSLTVRFVQVIVRFPPPPTHTHTHTHTHPHTHTHSGLFLSIG